VSAAAVPVLREVRLYGALGREFGRVFCLAVATPAEAVAALRAVLPGFTRALMGADGQARYHVLVGRRNSRVDTRRDLGLQQLQEPVGAAEPIRLVPVIEGAKRAGFGQVVLGAALIGLTIWNPLGLFAGQFAVFETAASIGAALVLGGVIQMLSPQRVGRDERVENAPSYAFDGPVNNTEQGGPVPLAYGHVVCGSTVVSQGLSTVDVALPGAYGDGLPGVLPPLTMPPYDWTPAWDDDGTGGGGG
jgi:predicted phage tail protein